MPTSSVTSHHRPKHASFSVLLVVAFGLLYTASLLLSQQLNTHHKLILWLPAGVAFAVLYRYGFRLWPGLVLGTGLFLLMQKGALLTALTPFLVDFISATGALLLLRYTPFCTTFSRLRDVLKFIFIVVLVAPLISSALLTLLFFNLQHPTPDPAHIAQFLALTWLGNSLGMAVAGALLLSWSNIQHTPRLRQWALELILLLIATALITHQSLTQAEALSSVLWLLLLLPLMVIIAWRTEQQGVTLSTLMIALLLGIHSPPSQPQTIDLSLLLINSSLLWLTALIGLAVAAAHQDHRLSKKLSYLASHDALTKLVNSSEFENRLQHAMDSCTTQNSQHTLLYLDLDRLKPINDNCGHAAGDELLRQVTEEFKSHVRTRDTVARLGGDEFAILLEHCSQKQGYEVGHSICESLEKFHFHCKQRSFSIGASIGLVTLDSSSSNVHELLMQADDACYVAKTMGGNRVQIHDGSGKKSDWQNSTASWASALSAGMQDHKLCLYFQPIHALRHSSAARGQQKERILELLVRGNNNGEILLPSAFLPTAERNKLMADLDRWVIKQSLRWISTHAAEAQTVTLFTINLSLQSLKDENMLRFITSRLQQYEVDARRICFEINEEVLNSNQAKTNRFIRELKQHGCRFTLDRFHNSASSLANLRDHPFDFVKLDPRLTKHIGKHSPDRVILKALLEVAQMLDLKVIASHIDDKKIYQQLTELGVEYIQGFYLSRPQALEKPLNTT